MDFRHFHSAPPSPAFAIAETPAAEKDKLPT